MSPPSQTWHFCDNDQQLENREKQALMSVEEDSVLFSEFSTPDILN